MPSRSAIMNGTCIIQLEEEDLFFDSRDDISSFSNPCPGSPDWYNAWTDISCSVKDRRTRFIQWMNSDSIESAHNSVSSRIAMHLSSDRVDNSLFSCVDEDPCISGDGNSEYEEGFRIKNTDNGLVFFVDKLRNNDNLRLLREDDQLGSSFSLSFVNKLMQKENKYSGNVNTITRKRKTWLLRRICGVTCMVDSQIKKFDFDKRLNFKVQRVKVRLNRKKCKEFSAVYKEQEIKAHKGSILTMKFSPNGEYLASGGEDGIVRIWEVEEIERNAGGGIPENDPSCIYFKVNNKSELVPLFVCEEKLNFTKMKTTMDSACVVVPPKSFRICEKPLHEFYGHDGDVLNLSWSNDNKFLLSSSVDKSVRLWTVGCNDCLKVYVHNNYVSCVQFNPVNANYFASGSIDGRIRIWSVKGHCVVAWTDIRDIISALCYSLDGKRVVVGTMSGDCRFYDASDNQLELDAQISLHSKKKSHDRRITGFQYCPSDGQKLLVTSADSQIRIIDGVDVISKYKGLRNSGSQIYASFTFDGRYIISASEDSNVYIWNHDDRKITEDEIKLRSNKSFERFASSHASVAISWQGSLASKLSETCTNTFTSNHDYECISEYIPKGASATWPEENLTSSSKASNQTLSKSEYKFLKNSCKSSSHAWSRLIVTAGYDGRIRSFQNYGMPVIQ